MATGQQIAQVAPKYLGTLYKKMDCQTFVEKCLSDCGIKKDLKGSNAWYRFIRQVGWIGTPEECEKKFGSIPVGAFLFIHVFDGGEVERGYHDGLGNAKHIGIKTGKTGKEMVAQAKTMGNDKAGDYNFGNGAIHSSYTRDHVVTGAFADKSINGGWNCVGLWPVIDYGQTINNKLSGGKPSGEGSGKIMTETNYPAKVVGGGLNLRADKSTDATRIIQIPNGMTVTVTGEDGDWAQVNYAGKTGWALKRFLQETEETITISKKDLQNVYDTIGDWLGLRG